MRFFGHDLPSVRHVLNRLDEYSSLLPNTVKISKPRLYFDYFTSLLLYGCGVMDYFLYEFYYLNHKGKKNFITVKQRVLFDNKNNTAEGVETILNKEKALMHFRKYIDRDWCGQMFHNTEEEFVEFSKKHKTCIVKPLKELGGYGISIISTIMKDTNLYQYCKENCLLVEELIQQHPEMNKLYEKSINTIRMVTVNGKCVASAIRIGAGGGIVDNAHAGGIFAEVDIETGIIISKAMNYKRKEFIRHPDTGIIIPGFQIPLWDEVKSLVTEAVKLIPDVSLIGWDIAITPDGPTIVEVNNMPSLELVQAPNRRGLSWAFEKSQVI